MAKKLIRVTVLCVLLIATGTSLAALPNYSESLADELLTIGSLNVGEIENLLANGADPNYISNHGRPLSILALLAMKSMDVENKTMTEDELIIVLNLLIKHGLKLQWCDNDVLFFPISAGCKQFTEALLKLGADPNSRIEGMTPVEIAEKYGRPDIADLLIEYGAKEIDTHDAAQIRLTQAATNHNVAEMEKAIASGANINADDNQGRSVLIESLRMCFYTKAEFDAIMYILKKGADTNHLAESGFQGMGKVTPLYMATFSTSIPLKPGRSQVLDKYKDSPIYARNTLLELIKAGAFVSGKTEFGQTPLHIAAQFNNIEAAKILIAAGAKVMPKDNQGKTPLDYAESAEMIKLLKANGATE